MQHSFLTDLSTSKKIKRSLRPEMPFCTGHKTTKWLKSMLTRDERESINDNNHHLFLNLHLSKTAGILLPRLQNQLIAAAEGMSYKPLPRFAKPYGQFHEQNRVGWCHQEEQGDEQLEGGVADVCRIHRYLCPQTRMIAKVDMPESYPVASQQSTKRGQFDS